jgi:Na+/H+ antiporter NhaD/arsenite permease-like protein
MQSISIYLSFLFTYAGMAAGRLPWLKVDRTGIALLGLILLLASQALTLDEIGARIDIPTIMLLFALMLISSQFVNSGFCDLVFVRVARARGGPIRMLALTVALAGGMAAFMANDIFAFVAAPLVLDSARERGFDPRPFLIALIAAANAGSAATIIGAPQTIVIGQLGGLRLPAYLAACGLPALVALVIVFAVILAIWRGRFIGTATDEKPPPPPHRPHDRAQTDLGILALACLLALFCTDLPKDVWTLGIAAIPLVANRTMTSRVVIAGVDWPLLLAVTCLFGITGALATTGFPGFVIDWLQATGLLPQALVLLAPLTLLMSCTIGTVPGTILFLQIWQTAPPGTLYGLALISSLCGNLLLIASISNLIIVERAAERGVVLRHRDFAAVGVPVTLLSVGFAVFWLWLTGFMPMLPEAAQP